MGLKWRGVVQCGACGKPARIRLPHAVQPGTAACLAAAPPCRARSAGSARPAARRVAWCTPARRGRTSRSGDGSRPPPSDGSGTASASGRPRPGRDPGRGHAASPTSPARAATASARSTDARRTGPAWPTAQVPTMEVVNVHEIERIIEVTAVVLVLIAGRAVFRLHFRPYRPCRWSALAGHGLLGGSPAPPGWPGSSQLAADAAAAGGARTPSSRDGGERSTSTRSSSPSCRHGTRGGRTDELPWPALPRLH